MGSLPGLMVLHWGLILQKVTIEGGEPVSGVIKRVLGRGGTTGRGKGSCG